ncbi:hypothetical protein B7463_g10494, partial [Scytalidium lignicola]
MEATILGTEPKVGVFSPVQQNPTVHLQVLRNPTHHLAHNDYYLSPGLHNSSQVYIDRLAAQARGGAPWLLTNQPVEVSKRWRGFRDMIDDYCPIFTLREVRKRDMRKSAEDDTKYSEYLKNLNEVVAVEMIERGWKFTRKECMDIKDAVYTEKETKRSVAFQEKANIEAAPESLYCKNAISFEICPTTDQAPVSFFDNYTSCWVGSQSVSVDLAGAGELGIVIEAKQLIDSLPLLSPTPIIGSPPRYSSKSDVSLSTIYEMESLEYDMTISEISQDSANTPPTPPMTPKLENIQFGSMPVSQQYVHPWYDSSESSDTSSDSDDDVTCFSPAKEKYARYLKDFQESRISAQTKLAMQVKTEMKVAAAKEKQFKREEKVRMNSDIEVYTLCYIVSLQLMMDLENIRLVSMCRDELNYERKSGTGAKEVHFVRGVMDTLTENDWYKAKIVDNCTTRLIEEGNWQLLEDPLSIEENLVGRSKEELQDWADTRARYIEQERQPTGGAIYDMESFDEAKRRMQFRFIWDVVIEELEKARNNDSD